MTSKNFFQAVAAMFLATTLFSGAALAGDNGLQIVFSEVDCDPDFCRSITFFSGDVNTAYKVIADFNQVKKSIGEEVLVSIYFRGNYVGEFVFVIHGGGGFGFRYRNPLPIERGGNAFFRISNSKKERIVLTDHSDRLVFTYENGPE